jgi:hypothetical protein
MTKQKPPQAIAKHFAAGATTGARIGFNVGEDTMAKFEEMADHFDVKNKDLFVAMVDVAYVEFEEDK